MEIQGHHAHCDLKASKKPNTKIFKILMWMNDICMICNFRPPRYQEIMPLRIDDASLQPNTPYTLVPATPPHPTSSPVVFDQRTQDVPYILVPATPPHPTSSSVVSDQRTQDVPYTLVPATPPHPTSSSVVSDQHTQNDMRHSSKRRKLSSGSYQEIYQDLVDGKSVLLDDFDIEDSDRKLPPRFFDIDDLPMSSSMKKAIEKAQEKRAEQAQRRKEKREAKSEEERRRQKEKRAEAELPEPKCASCGQEGHLRSSSKLCINYKPKNRVKMAAAGLTRKATIKSSLRTGCPNEILDMLALFLQILLCSRDCNPVSPSHLWITPSSIKFLVN
ncbi:unnamed protein product [Umbelopsis ramanniana]